ncbi:hexosaminidase D-like [Watersipora subatra]|uniref:hexosaminidase D-like n=1 Tax=Watersipora subatra TaxID=2589382 RepID=UPI00355C3898
MISERYHSTAGRMAPRGRQFSWATYGLIALAFFIVYKMLKASPQPPGMILEMKPPQNFDPPSLDKGNKPNPTVSEVAPDSNSLTNDEKAAALSALSGMQRVVHLDLKGAAPKVSYLEKLFPLLKSLGATGILIEWEDMFPYEGELEEISAKDCYSKADVQSMLSLAKDNHLSIIPLLQTFGHMEFVLKGEKYKHLREHPKQPQVINPHKPESLDLIKLMIDQQLALQPQVQQIHIGADEVWDLGSSRESVEQMKMYGVSKEQIFLNHIREVAGHVKNTHPFIDTLMWDDMFRNAKTADIEKSRVNKLVTPVVWKYTPNVHTILSDDIWLKYGKIFHNVWLASAFKGATGSDQILTDVSYHYSNHIGWLRIIAKISSTMSIEGMMLTGWQRYDHFGTLCELLPVAIPSLAVCLSAMQHAGVSKTYLNNINGLLGCRPEAPLQWTINTKDYPSPKCTFPGHRILEGVYALKNARYYLSFLDSKNSLAGWHKEYNLNRGFSQRSRMVYLLEKSTKAQKLLTIAEDTLVQELPKVFSEETVTEWLQTNIEPMKEHLSTKISQAHEALLPDTWPRRPIHKIKS